MLTPDDIQRLEQRRKLRPLLKALESVTQPVAARVGVAEALGRLGDDKAVTTLGVVAREAHDWPVVEASLHALGRIGSTAAVHTLVDATPFVHRKHHQRATILEVLTGTLRIRRAQLGPLEAWLASPQSWDTFSLVVDALGEVGGSQAVGLLKSCLYDADGRVRTRVADALDALDWPERVEEAPLAYYVALERWHDCISFGPAGLEAVIARARKGREDSTAAIVAVLASVGSADTIAALIRLGGQLATDAGAEEDARFSRGIKRRLDAVSGALRGHDQEAVSGLVQLLGASVSVAAHDWARSTAGWFGSAVFDAARSWLESPEATPVVRALAASALGRLRQGDAVGPLMRAWRNDATNDVRMAASDALVELGVPTVEVLRRALQAPDVPRRQSLLYLLQQMDVPEALELLCDEYSRVTDPVRAEMLASSIRGQCERLPPCPVTQRALELIAPRTQAVPG